MALIFYMSSRPAPEAVHQVPIYYDVKVVHIIEYGILSVLIFFGLNGTTTLSLKRKLAYSVLFTYLYGVTDEFHQMFNPARSAKFIDTITNLFAAALFQGMVWITARYSSVVRRGIS